MYIFKEIFVLGKIIWILICVMYGEKMTCVITEQLYNYESFASFWIISTLMRNADELACVKNRKEERAVQKLLVISGSVSTW